MYFSNIGIFWLVFGLIAIPVFITSLVCSIIKAVKSRKAIKERNRELKARREGHPVDTEIHTRRKPKIQFIEDEERKKEFRSKRGSLFYPSRMNLIAKFKDVPDTAVDLPTTTQAAIEAPQNNSDASNNFQGSDQQHDGNFTNNASSDVSNNTLAVTNESNNLNFNSNITNHIHNNNVYSSNINGVKGGGGKYVKSSGYNGRRRSLGSEYPICSESEYHNGYVPDRTYHGDSKDAMVMSSISKRGVDSYQGLKPPSIHNGRSRRHSVTSSTSILEKIPEGLVVPDLELSTIRSKSEDNLVDANSYKPHSTSSNNDCQGTDNAGFNRSTETTIM